MNTTSLFTSEKDPSEHFGLSPEDGWRPLFGAPRRSGLSRRDVFRIIMLCSMTLDHIGMLLYPHELWLRIIGRAAFPLVCMMCAQGLENTASRPRYLLRLLLFALISQLLVYRFILPADRLNPIFTLFIGAAAALGAQKRILLFLPTLFLLALPFILDARLNINYGFYGVMLVFLCCMAHRRKFFLLIAAAILNIWFVKAGGGNKIQLYSLIALFFAVVFPARRGEVQHLPKALFYIYYPAHMAVLGILNHLFDIL